jgi:hypothetical protein
MGSEHFPNADANRCHEPLEIPLIRPPGTFSPTGGEGWDEGVRFKERIVESIEKLSWAGGKPKLQVFFEHAAELRHVHVAFTTDQHQGAV